MIRRRSLAVERPIQTTERSSRCISRAFLADAYRAQVILGTGVWCQCHQQGNVVRWFRPNLVLPKHVPRCATPDRLHARETCLLRQRRPEA
jgi:hypothetical protein